MTSNSNSIITVKGRITGHDFASAGKRLSSGLSPQNGPIIARIAAGYFNTCNIIINAGIVDRANEIDEIYR